MTHRHCHSNKKLLHRIIHSWNEKIKTVWFVLPHELNKREVHLYKSRRGGGWLMKLLHPSLFTSHTHCWRRERCWFLFLGWTHISCRGWLSSIRSLFTAGSAGPLDASPSLPKFISSEKDASTSTERNRNRWDIWGKKILCLLSTIPISA